MNWDMIFAALTRTGQLCGI